MKKSLLLVLIISLFTYSIFADEYEEIYDLVVPESYSFLTIDGGLGNVGGLSSSLNYSENIIEISAVNGTFNFNIQGDASYRLFNQTKTDEYNITAVGNVKAGTISTGLFANSSAYYTSYDLDVNGMNGFWNAGGEVTINALTSSLTYTLAPYGAIGVGRVYSIYNVYRAKLMMEELGVEPTPEKVEKVVSVFQTGNEIFNRFNDDSTALYKEYYQKLADAMGISDRAMDVLILNTWNSQKYAFDRARFVNMISGWDGRFAATFTYQQNVGSSVFKLNAGPEARIGGFLVEDSVYYDADAEIKMDYNIGGAFNYYLDIGGRVVYLPSDFRWWAEAFAEIGYNSSSFTPFQFDIAGAGYYLINNNFRVYAGLRIDEAPGFYIFAGGEIRLW